VQDFESSQRLHSRRRDGDETAAAT